MLFNKDVNFVKTICIKESQSVSCVYVARVDCIHVYTYMYFTVRVLSTRQQGSGSIRTKGSDGESLTDDQGTSTSSGSIYAQNLTNVNKSLRSVISQGTTQQQIFADIGIYRGVTVALKHIRKEHIQLTRDLLLEFSSVRRRCV